MRMRMTRIIGLTRMTWVTGMTGKIRLAAITRITRMSKCFHSSGLHVPALLEENTYIGGLKNLPIHGTAYKDFKPVSLSRQLKSIPFTQPSMQIQCMRGRFQITRFDTMQICDVLSSQKCSSANAQFSYSTAVICGIHKIIAVTV